MSRLIWSYADCKFKYRHKNVISFLLIFEQYSYLSSHPVGMLLCSVSTVLAQDFWLTIRVNMVAKCDEISGSIIFFQSRCFLRLNSFMYQAFGAWLSG